MADEEEDTREFVPEKWTFIGVKRGQTVAKVHGYRRPNGKQRFYKKALASPEIVGHLYLVMVHEDGDQLAVKTGLEWLRGERADDYEALILEDRVEQKAIAHDQLVRSEKRKDDLKDACEPLVAIAARVPSVAARQALIDYVTRAILRA